LKNSKTLNRKRVNDMLDNMFNYSLTILSAGMGYGKTTAMQTFLNSKKTQTIWISLQGSDGDEEMFWHKLCLAAGRFYPEISEKLDGMGFPIDARQTAAVVERIWELDDGKTTVVVLDDYHLVDNNRHVNRLVEQLVRESIPHLHIILLSRTRPLINRSDLLSKGLSLELDTNLLAFTLPEIQEYCSLAGFRAVPEELGQIYRYTKGWISAAYLLLLGLDRGLAVMEITDISCLVKDNLFAGFDEETRQMLLKLSVLEHFTLLQALKILDDPRVPEIVARLVEQNAFVEHDRQSGVYRVHNVLLDFLRETAELSGADLKPVCHRAGQWFLEQKNIPEAFAFYSRAGKAEELLEYINRMERIDIGYLTMGACAKVYRELPREVIFEYPLPLLQFSCSFLLSGEESLAMSGIELMLALEEHFSVEGSAPEKLRRRILGEIEILKILTVFNDAEKMIEHSQKAEALLDGDSSWVIYHDNEFLMGVPHLLYTYYKEAGELKTIVELIQQGFPPKVFGGCGIGAKELALAEYALEIGDMENSLLYADKALVRAGMEKQVDIMMAARFVMIRAAITEGKATDALRQLALTEEWFDRQRPEISIHGKAIFGTTLELIRAYIYGCLRKPEGIPDWLKEGDLSRGVFMYQGMAFPCIIAGKAALLEGRFAQLEAMCEGFIESYGYLHNQLGILHNAVYLAAAKHSLYDMQEGLKVLLPALKEAQMDGILMPFVENADSLLPMLKELALDGDCGLDAGYLGKLIKLCKKYNRGLKNSQIGMVQLTVREKEVLSWLAQGLTQKEIANQLHLSIAAIKKYLGSAYLKLEVNNKISAVQKAKDSGLL